MSQLPAGRVRMFLSADVTSALAAIDAHLSVTELPVVALAWPAGANLARGIERVIGALAGVAWARWPDWYGESAPFSRPDSGEPFAPLLDRQCIDRLGNEIPELNRAWVPQAVARCRNGERPLVNSVPSNTQVKQLLLALAEPELILLLVLEEETVEGPELRAFANTAAWAAAETGCRVAAFVPRALSGAAELDVVAYDAVYVSNDGDQVRLDRGGPSIGDVTPQRNAGDTEASKGNPTRSTRGTATGGPSRTASRPSLRLANDEPLRLVFPPVLGRPHPSSPGEQLLAQWLQRDRELAPLFGFNQRLETTGGEAFIVDLLWREGRLAVEVDGYGWHSSPHVFAADRHRDYRLLCDGYSTLRLPHDEVMDDPALQCEKIRDVVRAIRKER